MPLRNGAIGALATRRHDCPSIFRKRKVKGLSHAKTPRRKEGQEPGNKGLMFERAIYPVTTYEFLTRGSQGPSDR